MKRRIVIGTRGSQLALWQTNWVRGELERLHPGIEVDIKIISTKGDRVLDLSLPKLGEQGKGLFTKELEDEMLDGRTDLAVHSLKDLPTELPRGLEIAAICEREDVRDALVARAGIDSLSEIPKGAVVGTSSLRRQAQLRAARPDLLLEPVRGNVDTRLRKLDSGQYAAIVLASAGLRRLSLGHRITQYLSPDIMLPAVGQGALAVETRAGDRELFEIVRALDHIETRLACLAERTFLKGLGGGCLVPIAAHALIEEGRMRLEGLVASTDGAEILRAQTSGPIEDAELMGLRLAEELLGRGALRILARM